jgi:hypothetical protein
MQRLVEREPERLAAQIIAASPSSLSFDPEVTWASPLATDDYREYRDAEFLNAVGLEAHAEAVRGFWPARGPRWDGLAKLKGRAGEQGVLLVEAKAHLAEMESDCEAEDPASIAKIRTTLAAVQDYYRVGRRDWMTRYYQFGNRLAHLYLLNVKLGVPTWLALVNFVDDQTHVPTTVAEWAKHYAEVFQWAGLSPASPLLERVVMVYPPVA